MTDAEIYKFASEHNRRVETPTRCVTGVLSFARAIEAAACAPLLERIAELEADRDQVRGLFNKSKDEFHTARQESSLRWQMICDLTNQRDALEAKLAQLGPDAEDLKDRLVAISSAVADGDDREAQAIIRTTLQLLSAAPAAPEQQEPDDAAVDAFAVAMKEKLAAARAKGRGGWQECDAGVLSGMLRAHVEKGDPRDVANFCMFLWSLGCGIAQAPNAQQAEAQPMECLQGDNGYACCEGGPCAADVYNDIHGIDAPLMHVPSGFSFDVVLEAANPSDLVRLTPEHLLAADVASVLFEVEQAIENGVCPWQIEAAFEAYEAARRLQLPDHGIGA